MLTWSRRFRLNEWARSSMWLIPAGCTAAAVLLATFIPRIDRRIDEQPTFVYSSSSAQEVLSAISSGMIAFTGFVFSILMLVVQFGSSAFSPRLLRWFSTGSTIKLALGVFVATFVYSLLVLSDVAPGDTNDVPQFAVNFSVVLVIASVLMFLRLIDTVMGFLRVAGIVNQVGSRGRRIVESMFTEPATGPENAPLAHVQEPAMMTVRNPGRGGVVQAADPRGIAEAAERSSAVVELIPAVGEFVGHGQEIFRVHGSADRRLERVLLGSIVLGDERTLRQDPAFAVRILVDIASKALSPGINDPTTAAQAIDYISDTLLALADRQIPDGAVRDDNGELRFAYPTPSWRDYVELGFTEIRTYGADSPQVVDALRSSLRRLHDAVPEWRVEVIDEQLELLDQATADAGS